MSHEPLGRRKYVLIFPLLAFAWFPQQLHAHRPVFTKDAAIDAETAIPISEPHVSQVVYREITDKSPSIWLGFKLPKDSKRHVQIGVPVLDRLKAFRPAMALVGPGLPDGDVPFDIPKGMGVKVLSTSQITKPRFFHEHFTGTDSWILRSDTLSLSKPGRYHLVAFSPEGQKGKLWLSIGKKESFSAGFWKKFLALRKKIRAFHEVK